MSVVHFSYIEKQTHPPYTQIMNAKLIASSAEDFFTAFFTVAGLVSVFILIVFSCIFYGFIEYLMRTRKMAQYLLDEYNKGQKSSIFRGAFLVKWNSNEVMRRDKIDRRIGLLATDGSTSDFVNIIFHIIRYHRAKNLGDKRALEKISSVISLHYRRYLDICHALFEKGKKSKSKSKKRQLHSAPAN